MRELTNWYEGFAKAAEASGITDPAEIQRLIAFHKRAELAAKHPEQFEDGFNSQVKSAQQTPALPSMPGSTELYGSPAGFTAEDITPDPVHHARNYGLGMGALGGLAGGTMGKLRGTGRMSLPPLPGGMSAGRTFRALLGQLASHPSGMRWGLLAGLVGALYGVGKGKFMSGRYGQGAPSGMTPEGYMSRMSPEIERMKALRTRLSGLFGQDPNAPRSPHAWYTYSQPQ